MVGYNDNARLPELIAQLVQRGVAVIATPASTPAALAAKAATTNSLHKNSPRR
jgi:putative tryptophan/tyrosine transport system substrate-binding protein